MWNRSSFGLGRGEAQSQIDVVCGFTGTSSLSCGIKKEVGVYKTCACGEVGSRRDWEICWARGGTVWTHSGVESQDHDITWPFSDGLNTVMGTVDKADYRKNSIEVNGGRINPWKKAGCSSYYTQCFP